MQPWFSVLNTLLLAQRERKEVKRDYIPILNPDFKINSNQQ